METCALLIVVFGVLTYCELKAFGRHCRAEESQRSPHFPPFCFQWGRTFSTTAKIFLRCIWHK